jgi:hypothetical protein
MASEREIIEATLRRCDGQAIGDPGYTVEQIAGAIAAALRESRKADVATVRRVIKTAPDELFHDDVAALDAAISRLAGDE